MSSRKSRITNTNTITETNNLTPAMSVTVLFGTLIGLIDEGDSDGTSSRRHPRTNRGFTSTSPLNVACRARRSITVLIHHLPVISKEKGCRVVIECPRKGDDGSNRRRVRISETNSFLRCIVDELLVVGAPDVEGDERRLRLQIDGWVDGTTRCPDGGDLVVLFLVSGAEDRVVITAALDTADFETSHEVAERKTIEANPRFGAERAKSLESLNEEVDARSFESSGRFLEDLDVAPRWVEFLHLFKRVLLVGDAVPVATAVVLFPNRCPGFEIEDQVAVEVHLRDMVTDGVFKLLEMESQVGELGNAAVDDAVSCIGNFGSPVHFVFVAVERIKQRTTTSLFVFSNQLGECTLTPA